MKLPFRVLALSAVISVLTLQLSGCGEEGNNLADPVAERINSITTCDGEKEICTSGQFIDEPVFGLNYECNQVKGLTDKDGIFSCPNNSVVRFYLQAEKGKYRINLGAYLVKALGDISGSRQNTLLQITPNDLVVTVTSTNASGGTGLQVTNILRLLQVMDSHKYNEATPVLNRIVITDEDKSYIDLLGADMAVSAFASDFQFAQTLQPLLKKLERALPSAEVANARFNQSLSVLQSGVYEVSPFIIGAVDKANNRFYSGMVGETSLSDEKAFEGLFFIIDRDAKLIGTGLEWRDKLSATELATSLLQKTLFEKTPQVLSFNSADIGFEKTGKITPNFKLTAADGSIIEITQGQMANGNLSGSEFFFRNVYGLTSTEKIETSKLGKWRRTGTLALEGTVNMSKSRNVSPFLDGAIWKTKDNEPNNPVFPLHLKLTFSDNEKTVCAVTGCLPVGTMGISILANGNIITDLNNNCRAVKNLMEEEDLSRPSDLLIEEHRLGVVSAVFQDAIAGAAISPIILVDHWAKNDPQWGKFYGLFMGMQSGFVGGSKVQINIAKVRDKIVTMQNQQDNQAASGVEASWSNYRESLIARSTKPVDVQKIALDRAKGRVTKIEVQDCNAFLK